MQRQTRTDLVPSQYICSLSCAHTEAFGNVLGAQAKLNHLPSFSTRSEATAATTGCGIFIFLPQQFFSSFLKSQQSRFKPLAVAWVCICFVQNGSCIHTGWEKKFPATSLCAVLKERQKAKASGRDIIKIFISEMPVLVAQMGLLIH